MPVINRLPKSLTQPGPQLFDANDVIGTNLLIPAQGVSFKGIIFYGYEYGDGLTITDNDNQLFISADAQNDKVIYQGTTYNLTPGNKTIVAFPQTITLSANAVIENRLSGRVVLTEDYFKVSDIQVIHNTTSVGTVVSAQAGATFKNFYVKSIYQHTSDFKLDNPWGNQSPYNIIVQPYYEILKFWFGNYKQTIAERDLFILPKPFTIPNISWTGCGFEIQMNFSQDIDITI